MITNANILNCCVLSVTNFTFSKNKSSCCEESDLRIRFSKLWTSINCLVSTLVMAFVVAYYAIYGNHSDKSHILHLTSGLTYVYGPGPKNVKSLLTIMAIVVPHIIAVIFTVLFLLFDHISCCCCACWRGQQEVVVYDPDHPEASLVWRDGEVMDIGVNNMEKTRDEVVEMTTKEDEGDEKALVKINPKDNKDGAVRRIALSYEANLF